MASGSWFTIEYDDDGPDDWGRRRFTICWSTPSMRDTAKHGCDGSCCVKPDGTRHVSALHTAVRGQCFHAQPKPHIAKMRASGFTLRRASA